MSYIDEAFPRINLQQIRSFILHGTEEFDEDIHPYRETLKNGTKPIYQRLNSLYPFGSELDSATADLSEALAAYEAVYMEIGMKAGARLIWQLLLSDDQPPLERS